MADGSETGSKVQRIAGETRALVDDVKTWVDLRLQLTQLEVEGRINEAGAKGLVVVLGGIALLFALVGLALLIGEWSGRPYVGFFSVAGILLLITAIVWVAKPRMVRIEKAELDKAPKRSKD